MPNDTAPLKDKCTSKGPSYPSKAAKLHLKIGFRYRQAIGFLMFEEVTHRPDELFSATLLSQNITSTKECHSA